MSKDLLLYNHQYEEHWQSTEVMKKLSAMTVLIEELSLLLKKDQQKEKIAMISERRTELIALSERDAYIEGFKLGVKMTTEIYADTQQR